MNIQENKRTSVNQLRLIYNVLYGFLRASCVHLRKFGLGYGFLFGSTSTLLILVATLWYGILAYPLPWKVTDAENSKFDTLTFKFTDYDSDLALFKTLNKLLPVGTSKRDVDRILGSVGGAKISKFLGKDFFIKGGADQRYYYEYRNIRSVLIEAIFMLPEGEASWKVSIVFDKNEKLLTLNVI